jgi:hypothetical protein
MAKAIARCTCTECGDTFTKERTFRSRSEADSWEKWAESNYTQCSKCYGKKQREKELALPPTITISLLPFHADKPVLLVWSGNTMDVKDQIKEMGYVWDEPPSSGVLGALEWRTPRKTWYKMITLDKMQESMDQVKTIENVVIKNEVRDIDLITLKQLMSEKAKYQAQIDEEVKALGDRPKKPECYPVGKWNGRIYGKSGAYRIYVDNVEQWISDDEVKLIQEYQKKRDEYNKKVDEIKKKYH